MNYRLTKAQPITKPMPYPRACYMGKLRRFVIQTDIGSTEFAYLKGAKCPWTLLETGECSKSMHEIIVKGLKEIDFWYGNGIDGVWSSRGVSR